MIYIYEVVAGGATITSATTISFQITDLVNFNDGTERTTNQDFHQRQK